LIKTIPARLNTLRWRLTLFYSGLVAVLLLAAGLFIYFQLEGFLVNSASFRLADRAEGLVGRSPDAPGPKDRSGRIETIQELANRIAKEGNTLEIYAVLLNNQGQPIQSNTSNQNSPPFTAPLPTDQNLKVAQGTRSYSYVTTLQPLVEKAPSERGLVFLQAIVLTDASDQRGYLLMASSFSESDAALRQLRNILFIALMGALFSALLLGLPLVRLGLIPLKKITRTAVHIKNGDLSQRVPSRSAASMVVGDEVQQLALAFNQMLDQIEASFQAQKQSEDRNRRFAADASHELRSPLTVLGGYLDVLLMGIKDDPTKAERILRSMRREVDRLSRLVVDMLTLTRLDTSDTSSLKLEPIPVKDLLARAVEDMQMVAENRTLTLKIPPQAASVILAGDSDQLYRVMINLLDNAIRYTTSEGVIEIYLEISPQTGQVEIRVADNGCGIAPDRLTHIFDRFYRADQSRSRQTGNSGLGLAIVKAIVEAHGGTVTVESVVGKGTSFTIKLPSLTSKLSANFQ
jgi:heavy metal sensor kinase